jgi:hypothetical protein
MKSKEVVKQGQRQTRTSGRAAQRQTRTSKTSRTSTDQGAEPSFPGRPGPGQTKWQSGTKADQDQHRPGPAQTEGQSPLSQADRDQGRPSGRQRTEWKSHPLGPFRGNAGVTFGPKVSRQIIKVTNKKS